MTRVTLFGQALCIGVALLAGAGHLSIASAQPTGDAVVHARKADEAGIRKTMAAYNAALNGGQTAAVLPLYTPDGIFMAPYTASNVGTDAIRASYDAVFKDLKFDVKFDIVELVQMAPTWAYVRTNSAGTTAHASSGKTTSEANQELFILEKGHDGQWRIARYSFSPTNPPANG